METVITEVPCNQTNQIHTYCEGMVTEDSKKMLIEAFDDAVNVRASERVEIEVQSALQKLDEDHSGKLEQLLEAIDTDHTQKLVAVLEKIDEDHGSRTCRRHLGRRLRQ